MPHPGNDRLFNAFGQHKYPRYKDISMPALLQRFRSRRPHGCLWHQAWHVATLRRPNLCRHLNRAVAEKKSMQPAMPHPEQDAAVRRPSSPHCMRRPANAPTSCGWRWTIWDSVTSAGFGTAARSSTSQRISRSSRHALWARCRHVQRGWNLPCPMPPCHDGIQI